MRLLTFFSIYFITSLAMAQIYNSSTTSAMGGSGRAAVEVGGASFSNPATLVHQRGRQILLSQGFSEMAASFSENTRDIIFPAALGFVRKTLDMPESPVIQDARLTLAEAITGRVAFGATASYYQVKVGETIHQQGNADMGLIYTPAPDWGLAVVGYDMMGGREEIPEIYRRSPRFAVGMNYLFRPTMRIRLDVLSAPNNTFKDLTTMAGYEVYVNRWIVSRLGYQEDLLDEKRLASFGVGLDLPKFDLNYAFSSELPRNESHRHSIDLSIAF